MEPARRVEDAATREVKEETGLDSEIVRFMGTHVYERNGNGHSNGNGAVPAEIDLREQTAEVV